MVCPFRLSICAVILTLATATVFFHFYFSDDTIDYILQWIPLPDKMKDWLYTYLTSPTSPMTTTSASFSNSSTTLPILESTVTSSPTMTLSSTNSTTSANKPTKQRPNRQFNRQDVPQIVKVLKYVTMVLIVYLHIELIYYQFTSSCLTAQIFRGLSTLWNSRDGIQIAK